MTNADKEFIEEIWTWPQKRCRRFLRYAFPGLQIQIRRAHNFGDYYRLFIGPDESIGYWWWNTKTRCVRESCILGYTCLTLAKRKHARRTWSGYASRHKRGFRA